MHGSLTVFKGAIAQSVTCPFCIRLDQRLIYLSGTFLPGRFGHKITCISMISLPFLLIQDSHLLVSSDKCAQSTGNLPLGGRLITVWLNRITA